MLRTVQGGGEIPAFSGNEIRPWHKATTITSDGIKAQLAACRSVYLAAYWGWIEVLREKAGPLHVQGWSRAVSVCYLANEASRSMQAFFITDADNTNIPMLKHKIE